MNSSVKKYSGWRLCCEDIKSLYFGIWNWGGTTENSFKFEFKDKGESVKDMMLHKIKPVSGGITVYDTVTPNGGIHDLFILLKKSHCIYVLKFKSIG